MGDRDDKKISPARKLLLEREFISVMEDNPTVAVFTTTTKEGNTYYNVTLNEYFPILEICGEIDVMLNEVKQDDSTPGLSFLLTNALNKNLADSLLKFSRLKTQAVDAFIAANWKNQELRVYPMIKVSTFVQSKDPNGNTMWVKMALEKVYMNLKVGTVSKTGSKFNATAFYDLREQYDWKKLPVYEAPSKSSLERVEDKANHPLYYNSHGDIVEAWGRSLKVSLNINLYPLFISQTNKICTLKASVESVGIFKTNAHQDNSFMKNKILAQVKARVGNVFKLPQ